MTNLGKPRHLQCCCCGGEAYGRQWFNRDTGYGLCDKCALILAKKETPEEMQSNYGTKGIHYLINNTDHLDRTLDKNGYYDCV